MRNRTSPSLKVMVLFAGSLLPIALVGCADQQLVAPEDARELSATAANDPLLPDAVVTVSAEYCELTVTARRTAHDVDQPGYAADFFRVERAVGSGETRCMATFNDLPIGSRWVFSVHNTVIEQAEHFSVWPNPFPEGVVPEVPLPAQQGAVYLESQPAGSRVLTTANYYAALLAATPFAAGEVRNMILLSIPGRVVPCIVGSGMDAFVHVMLPLDPALVPPHPFSTLPPASGLFIERSTPSQCALRGLGDEHVVAEAIDPAGLVYRALVGPNDTDVVLEPDPPIFRVHYIVDRWEDAQPQDIGLVIYGLASTGPGGPPTDEFIVKADVRGLTQFAAPGTASYRFEVRYGTSGAAEPTQQITVLVNCNTSAGVCRIRDIAPASEQVRVLAAIGSTFSIADAWIAPGTGAGYVTLRFDFTGVQVADLRVRSVFTGGTEDLAPNQGYARWSRGEEEGNSWLVSF